MATKALGLLGSLPLNLPDGRVHPVVKAALCKEEAKMKLAQNLFEELSIAQGGLAVALADNRQLKQERVVIHKAQAADNISQQLQIERLEQQVATQMVEINKLESQLNSILRRIKKTEVRSLLEKVMKATQDVFEHEHDVYFTASSTPTRTSSGKCDCAGNFGGKGGVIKYYPESFKDIPKSFYED